MKDTKEMFFKKLDFIKRLIAETTNNDTDGSIGIADKIVLNKYINDPDFPFIISFPRTGSHWLRMIMELYFERPSLVRVFYCKDKNDYLTLHTHDMELDVYKKNVIYLYRNPIPTVFSQMMYEKEDINDNKRVEYWTRFYGRHLTKWLIEEKISEKKTIIRYENMLKDIESEFSKITQHFGVPFDPIKLKKAAEHVSKHEVKKKTTHDKKVVNLESDYEHIREIFHKKYSDMIENLIFTMTQQLSVFFNR